jgi:hypothetical protein
MSDKKHPFYGQEIIRRKEQAYVDALLLKYRQEPVSEELKQKIWDELQKEKSEGKLTIPFKVVARRDPSGKFPEYIEVILDTKV